MNYLFWLTLCVWLPLIIMWARHWQYLSRYRRTFIYCMTWALIFSIPWDLWAVSTRIWIFPPDTNIGLYIGGLPLEEYLFMIFVTVFISTATLLLRRRADTAL